MVKGKLKLAYIPNVTRRKETFRKRKKGLLKKVDELSVLCGVDACAIIYSPYNTEPEIWPPNPFFVRQILEKYREIPETDQRKKKLDLESHLSQRLEKAIDQYKKQKRDTRQKEVNLMLHNILNGQGLSGMDSADFNDLMLAIDKKLREIDIKSQTLRNGESSSSAEPGSSSIPKTTKAANDGGLWVLGTRLRG